MLGATVRHRRWWMALKVGALLLIAAVVFSLSRSRDAWMQAYPSAEDAYHDGLCARVGQPYPPMPISPPTGGGIGVQPAQREAMQRFFWEARRSAPSPSARRVRHTTGRAKCPNLSG